MSTEITINQSTIDINVTEQVVVIEAPAGAYPLPSTVSSVFGRTGAILALNGDYNTSLVTENTNLYFTNARARSAISLTTTGTSGAATYNSITGVLNVPEYQGGVTSFNTRTGAISLLSADVTSALAYTPVTNARTLSINGVTYDLTADRSWTIATGSGTVTSLGLSAPTGFSVTNSPITTSGTLALGFSAGYSLPTDASQSTWNTAYNRSLLSASVTGTTTKTLTLNQQDGGTITASWTDINTDAVTSVFGRTGAVVATEGDYNLTQLGDVTITTPSNGQVLKYNGTTWVNGTDTDTGLTSVGLSMPSAFTVSNSPLTANGTLSVTGAGTTSQYVRGDGTLANFPTSVGGGSSVSYYLNGSVNQGTIGGVTYYEMNKVPIIGAGTDFARGTNGYIASFLTDANDPALLEIPAGNWNFETYLNASNGGGSPSFYIELYKYDGTTFTLIASNSATPKLINDGASIEAYFSALAVPQTTLTLTDRLAVRIYVNTSGRTITLHTENGHLCQVITTFTTGITALNGLTTQVQFFGTGTSGTDFNIASSVATHTFNLPIASATNTGKLNSSDWSVFNNKQTALSGTGFVKISGTTISYDNSTYYLASNPSAFITLTSLSGSTGISYNNTTGAISSTITQYTDALARASISLTTTGSSGAATYDNTTGVLNIPQYTGGGGGGMAIGGSITSATAGSVLFAGASGVLAQKNANFFWDNTNNSLYLGGQIGSSLEQLQIKGAYATINSQTTNSASYSGMNMFDSTGVLAASFAFGNSAATPFNNSMLLGPRLASGLLYFVRGASATISATIDASGNFGINTTTIGSKFQVNGNAAIGYSASTAAPTNGLIVAGTSTFSDNVTVSKNGNFVTSLTISNSTSGTGSGAKMYISSNSAAGGAEFGKQSSTSSAYKNFGASDFVCYNGTAGNISFLNDFPSGGFNIVTGGIDIKQFVINSAGSVGFSTNTIGSKVQINGNLAVGYSASTAAPTNGLAVSGATTIAGDTSISGVLRATITTNRQTASYTLVLTDRGKLVEMNVATANNLTIPLNSSVAFPIGTQIDLSQYGAGQTTIVATGGVTIRSTNSWLKLNAQYAAATLIKIGTDEWYLFGNLNA